LKRLLDISASLLALLVLSPLLVLLALWIRVDSPGPVFFRQKRIGRDREPLYVIKFRTMTHREPDTIDQHAEQVLSTGDDQRITRSGRFLRMTSLDELPQLLNILKGEMSLVGPRPVIPEQLEVVPHWFEDRFRVRPGITGLAQVRGRRSLSWEQQLQFDTEYARKCNFIKDLSILLQTVLVVLTARGIYGDPSKNWRAYREKWAPHAQKEVKGNT
jgi:lipopolysaccharide/colanic/teichoic acid biosynthesis glycosyltransferase